MVSTVQIVCTGRKIISQLLKIDGSFFVPYFTLILCPIFTNKDRCTACLYGMVSRIIMLSFSTALPRCFPKASAKVVLFFISANKWRNFFAKKLNFFKQVLIFNDLQKQIFSAFFKHQYRCGTKVFFTPLNIYPTHGNFTFVW